MIELMLKRFSEVWNRTLLSLPNKGLSVYRVVTVASMVEKEALFDSERQRIAGVIHNRLRDGMLLQVDATVLYSLGGHKEKVTLKDLEVDSPITPTAIPGCPRGRLPHRERPAFLRPCSRKNMIIFTMWRLLTVITYFRGPMPNTLRQRREPGK